MTAGGQWGEALRPFDKGFRGWRDVPRDRNTGRGCGVVRTPAPLSLRTLWCRRLGSRGFRPVSVSRLHDTTSKGASRSHRLWGRKKPSLSICPETTLWALLVWEVSWERRWALILEPVPLSGSLTYLLFYFTFNDVTYLYGREREEGEGPRREPDWGTRSQAPEVRTAADVRSVTCWASQAPPYFSFNFGRVRTGYCSGKTGLAVSSRLWAVCPARVTLLHSLSLSVQCGYYYRISGIMMVYNEALENAQHGAWHVASI